jgi:hypothetical protein
MSSGPARRVIGPDHLLPDRTAVQGGALHATVWRRIHGVSKPGALLAMLAVAATPDGTCEKTDAAETPAVVEKPTSESDDLLPPRRR